LKTIRTKFLSLLLALVTILSLLPTSAFAASNTGSGLKITTNQAYWSTRLLANGTPYSYRPPLVDGKLVYCMDSGLGYHYATPSYLNSFTWTSGSGADADAVLQSALTNSGLSEMDAATVENVKWMMTYLNDCKESNVGQLFMAVQTYVWENQSYKGEPGGDGDAGGYANADTYELYLSLIDSLLAKKAAEDAEFQRQIEEYAAQGIAATIVEDESAKWAVFAISSNRKNQSFFNYYGPRKLVTGEPAPDQPEQPTGGTGKIVLKKTAGGTTTGLAGARFSIYFNGQIVGSDITNAQGEIYVEDAATGLWSFVETSAPDGYCVDPAPKSVYVDVSEGDREYTVAAVNYEKPDMKITKRDAMSGKPIAGAVFSVKSVTGSYSTSVTTGTDGSATLSALPAGVYVVREESVPEPYVVSHTEQTVALRPGKTSEVTFVDYEKPGLEIVKKNIANGEPIEGVTYRIEQIDGSFSTSATTDNHGRIFLDSVPVGTFKVTEINVPSHVILCPIPQEVALKPGETSTVTFFNALKPSMEIRKVDSVTGDPIKGAKFQIWYASNHTDTGELNDLGTYFSDASGKIILPEIKDGWYKVTELEPASGYAIKEPATQECFISGGESKVLTFENTPLSAIIIRKVDSESGQPLEGAWFRIRYLGGTSGTDGTVIGEYRTSSNGTIVVTGLKAGTYVCEEISAPDGYVITDATETVYLSGKDQDVITVTFGNDKMGSLLIVKKDAVTGSPISDVEFFITDSDGSVIGNANGKYVTDSAGTIRIDGLTPGMTVIAREVRAKDGYILDDTPQSIKIKRNAVMTLEFRNQPKGGVLVKKVDAVTNAPISDVEFLVTDSDGNLIGNANGKFVTDSVGIVSLGGIYYAAHYVCPGIGRMAVNDELAAFHNHTNFGKNTQRAFLFAGSSYESVIEELKTQDEKRNEKLIRYGEAYHCLHAPIHLLSCDETGAQQLQIMTVPDYRVKLTRLMLRSAYQPPPEDIAAWDGLYNGHPFVIGADMDLRRIDTAVRTAKQHGCLPIALAALESQGSAVLLQRYADPGCATVYKVTENVLSELLGRAPNLYVPPRTQFLTEKGDVVDAPLIKAPGKAGGPHRK